MLSPNGTAMLFTMSLIHISGLLISVFIYGVGGGLLEVLMNPVAGACPVDNKASVISLLNSFYSWWSVGIVLLSTIFFSAFGLENWKVLALIWAIIPIFNIFLFAKVPIGSMIKEGEQKMSLKSLLSYKVFWIMLVLMLSAGACEQAIIQWASTFVEQGLGISKTIGDLAGPMSFAFMMGISRSVSYTHLDVYKRQITRGSRSTSCR